MGPSYTGFKDAPLRLGGEKPNTTTGKFFVKKGRVQLEKPRGVDAISGDVIVGGQGFNDCLFWKQSDQLKDSVNITLLDAGNNGAAYLHLNGCSETAASLTMTAHNKVKTDAPERRQRHADREITDHRRGQEASRQVHRGHRKMDRRQRQGGRAALSLGPPAQGDGFFSSPLPASGFGLRNRGISSKNLANSSRDIFSGSLTPLSSRMAASAPGFRPA